MKLIYTYNEILPKKRAHDIFIVHECAAFAEIGWDVTLCIGKGSDPKVLAAYYSFPFSERLHMETLMIVRKNNPFGISWNLPFFISCQKKIGTLKPDFALFSVRKQAAYHFKRKIAHVKYIYEVHELCHYPSYPTPNWSAFLQEQSMLALADKIIVTTSALKKILASPPYDLKTPIDVIPLAVSAKPLPPPSAANPLIVMYVGQLYAGQGIPLLLEACASTEQIFLKIVGGTTDEIFHLFQLSQKLKIANRIEFLGFIPPNKLADIAKEAHAFVAPFEDTGRMPYVAHTKLFEYAEWGRPIIAPRLPIVEEHFQDGKGVLLFEPNSTLSLANALTALLNPSFRLKLQSEIEAYSGRFSWQSRVHAYAKVLS